MRPQEQYPNPTQTPDADYYAGVVADMASALGLRAPGDERVVDIEQLIGQCRRMHTELTQLRHEHTQRTGADYSDWQQGRDGF